MSFDKLVYGQQKWNDTYNANLDKTEEVQDTGWQNVLYLASAGGTLKYRVVQGVLYLQGLIAAHSTALSSVATLPVSNRTFTGIDITSSNLVRCNIGNDGGLTIYGLNDSNKDHQFSLDGIALYVGNW